MSHALLGTATLAYCGAGMGYLWYLVHPDPPAPRIAFWSLAGGLLLHALAIACGLLDHAFLPATNIREGLSLLAWMIGIAYLILGRRLRLPILGAFILPIVLVIVFPALAVPIQDRPLTPALHAGLLPLHVVAAFLGNALFALAFGVGLVYLLQERELKRRGQLFAIWNKLPSLEILDGLNSRLVAWGFTLLTFAIVSGALVAKRTWGSAWSWEPREALAFVTWVLFAGLIGARQLVGWRGRRVAVLTMIGFLLVMGSFVGLALCPVDRHGGTFQ